MNTDGSGQVNLTNHAANDTTPNWAPDGSKLVFVSSRTDSGDIYLMNADGSGQEVLKGDAAASNVPAWAPQGDSIAWALHNGSNYDLVRGPATIVNLTSPLYASAGQDESPDWQPINSTYARPKATAPLLLPRRR